MNKLFTMLLLFAFCTTISFAQNESKTNESSKNKVAKTSATNVASYDFTTGSDKYYGGANGAKEIEAGVWGMVAGDINQDGQITSLDYDIWNPNAKAAVTGYSDSDVNMDGQNTSLDYDLWNPNAKAAKTSQVPN